MQRSRAMIDSSILVCFFSLWYIVGNGSWSRIERNSLEIFPLTTSWAAHCEHKLIIPHVYCSNPPLIKLLTYISLSLWKMIYLTWFWKYDEEVGGLGICQEVGSSKSYGHDSAHDVSETADGHSPWRQLCHVHCSPVLTWIRHCSVLDNERRKKFVSNR